MRIYKKSEYQLISCWISSAEMATVIKINEKMYLLCLS